MQWYAINTKPHQEKKAEFHVRQFGLETFLPLFKESRRIRRVPKTVVTPFFPGYFFARFDVHGHYRAVSYAGGVRKIVEFGMKPAPLSEALIQTIKQNLEDGYVTLKPERFCKGQIVHINGGPLTGLEAVFLRETSEKNRVLLLLNTIRFRARLDLGIEQICLPQARSSCRLVSFTKKC
jgi:transcriptional antiterminator RfaH